MSDVIAPFCSNHPTVTAKGRCKQCGKPFCVECTVEDVATDELFCSRECRDLRHASPGAHHTTTNHELLAAYATPIRSGWKLWLESIPALSVHAAPLAVVMALVADASFGESTGAADEPAGSGLGILGLFFLTGIGVVLTQVVMTQRYTGLVQGNPYLWALKRFIPWGVALSLSLTVTFIGYLLMVLPGIYLGLRLFWAEEFALIHQPNPLRALKESWDLTESSAGSIFGFQVLVGLANYVVLLLFAGVLGALLFLVGLAGGGFAELLEKTVMFWAAIVGYAGFHAPEIVYLYGMRAEQATSVAESTKTLNIA